MTSPNTTRRLRWAVPAATAVVVAGAIAVPAALAGTRTQELAPRSAAQLLVDLGSAEATSLSGTVVQTSRLGLPELPGAGGTTGPMSLTSGSNTLRVWSDGPERSRVALLGQLAEYDVVRSGSDVWTYSSQKDEAVHYRLPAETGAGKDRPTPTGSPDQLLPSTPAQAAQTVLAALEPTTTVGVEESVTVAGRAARQLLVTPKDSTSLVGSVRIAVDAETSAPLRVQVFAAADREEPAFEVGFTDVDFGAPELSVFAFTPPPGADVRELDVPDMAGHDGAGDETDGTEHSYGGAAPDPAGPTPQVVGEGWTSILLVEGVGAAAATQSPLLEQLTTRVPEGRLLATALVTVLLTDDGRLLVGAVTPEVLRAAA